MFCSLVLALAANARLFVLTIVANTRLLVLALATNARLLVLCARSKCTSACVFALATNVRPLVLPLAANASSDTGSDDNVPLVRSAVTVAAMRAYWTS